MVRILGVLVLALFAASISLQAEPAPAPRGAPFHYACTLFDHKNNATAFAGALSADQFHKWFKVDYAVSGERVETPENATPFGALSLSDGHETLIMPLYQWSPAKATYCACQSAAIGKAPRLSVYTDTTQADFIAQLKSELHRIETE